MEHRVIYLVAFSGNAVRVLEMQAAKELDQTNLTKIANAWVGAGAIPGVHAAACYNEQIRIEGLVPIRTCVGNQ